MTILDFNLRLPASRLAALDERDRIIAILQENGYRLLMTDDGTRVLMEQETKREKPEGCGCVCNPNNGLGIRLGCGDCGHPGCGMKKKGEGR